jgi:hypothetical protein
MASHHPKQNHRHTLVDLHDGLTPLTTPSQRRTPRRLGAASHCNVYLASRQLFMMMMASHHRHRQPAASHRRLLVAASHHRA